MPHYIHILDNLPPYLKGLLSYLQEKRIPFHIPGHKQGQSLPPDIQNLFCTELFNLDLTASFDRDDLYHPQYFLKRSMDMAKDLYGTRQTYYIVNGSTGANQYALISSLKPNDKVIIPRNCHKLILGALITAQALPVYVMPEYNASYSLYTTTSSSQLIQKYDENPDTKVICTINPSYHGFTTDLQPLISKIKNQQTIMVNDEAHGAHFSFHPHLPPSTLDLGADITIQSVHKNMSGLSQTSLLHVQGDKIDMNKLEQVIYMYQTSSPSTLLLASIDYAIYQMAQDGKNFLENTLSMADFARHEINKIAGIQCVEEEIVQTSRGLLQEYDPTKLVVSVQDLGITGYHAKDFLGKRLGIEAELADPCTLLFIVTGGNTVSDMKYLIQGLHKLSDEFYTTSPSLKNKKVSTELIKIPELALLPTEAFHLDGEIVSFEQSLNRISKEFIISYPPGISVLMPGEIIDRDTFDYLKRLKTMQATFIGTQDHLLECMTVVK